jgi:hypothetical protein
MILVGILCLILGWALAIHILWIIGIVLVVFGLVLLVAGRFGHPVRGRSHYW